MDREKEEWRVEQIGIGKNREQNGQRDERIESGTDRKKKEWRKGYQCYLKVLRV